MKKFLALALAVLVVCSLCVIPTAAAEAYNSDVTINATVTPDTVKTNKLPETVTFTIKTSKSVQLFSIGYKVVVPEGWTIEKIESGSNDITFRPILDCSLDRGTVSWYSAENIYTDTIGKITVKIPAGETVGNRTITVKNVELSTTGKNGENPWMSAGTASATVTLDKDIPVAGVTLDTTSATLFVGENKVLPLKATVVPDNATNKNITWTSSNEGVATVSNGLVTAVAPGTAKITVKTEDGGFTATCEVTVKAKVDGVSLNKTALTLDEGKDETLTATINPANASNKNISWKSSDESVATVANGKVTAKKAGKATITVTTEDGNFTASCEVTVSAKQIPVSGISIDIKEIELTVEDTKALQITVSPAEATNPAVVWTSSDESVATVKDGIVTALKAGTTTITVKTEDGGFSASCVVTVSEKTIAVTGVSLDAEAVTLKAGETKTLTATVAPADASNLGVIWSSSDESVATVVDGLVTALKAGTATITVTSVDGSFTAECVITVEEEVSPVTADMTVGASLVLCAAALAALVIEKKRKAR